MPDVLTAASGAYGARQQAKAAKSAANAQVQSAAEASRLQREMFDRQVELQEPFRQGGLAGQNRLMELLGIGGNAGVADYGRDARDFSMNDFEVDPGYAFRLSEGNKALERSAAARGMVMSGSMFKGAQRFGQDLASQEYQNAFNRFQTNRSSRLNPLMGMAGAGQNATNVVSSAAGQLGQNLGENAMGAGNARASGYIGSANAYTNAINQMNNLRAQQAGMMMGGR
jgi:hypothetical protein